MSGIRIVRIAAASALAMSLWACPALARCRPPLPIPVAGTAEKRPVRAEDLARLRDIGPVSSAMFLTGSPFSLSPDGKRIAFQIRQADPDTNTYCLAMVVLDLASRQPPLLVDQGGLLIRVRFRRGSLADYSAGDAQLITPLWSPDGARIAFLKRLGAKAQIWLAKADGSGSRQLTHAPVDIDSFVWNTRGTSLVFRTRPAMEAERKAIAREGLRGYHYDDRWSPVASNHPWPSEPKPSVYSVIGIRGVLRPADAAEKARLDHPEGAMDVDADWRAWSLRGLAWVAPAIADRNRSEGQLRVRLAQGSERVCDAPTCRGSFKGLWWSSDRQSLSFMRKEGWGGSETALYAWSLDTGAARRVLSTRALLLGCLPASARLICAFEQSSRPRRVIAIRMESGAIEELFDPNPAFGGLKLGSVERLEWRNDRGIEIYGDLVLPPARRPSDPPLPLVIVQYQTRGFLRGGTDDEFPIFPLAAQGFAVLSLERPGYVADQEGPRDTDARIKLNYEGWADRRSVLSAFRTGIDLLAKRGVVDLRRVGITGLSDGTASAQFALVSSNLFAAASLTACCEDPKTMMPLLGNNGTAQMRRYLYPAYTDDAPDFWKPYSMARNAAIMRTPLLMQSADDEYLMALETYASLRETGTPVDLYVFPGEHHMKWQPAHRLAIYRRNLAWFSFWLTGAAGPYADPAETARWSDMRDKLAAPPSN